MDPSVRPLLYLPATDCEAVLPRVEERLLLARRAMIALQADADVPPKIGVHARPAASFAHAMPAWLPGSDPQGRDDLLGMKWVTGFPGDSRRRLPRIHGTVLLSDPLTGRTRAILDAGVITAHRTAAVSGVCLEHWRGVLMGSRGGPAQVAMVGAGVQARAHLPVVGHLLPGAHLTIHDRHEERARALAAEGREMGTLDRVDAVATAALAVAGADVVLTMVSFGPKRQGLSPATFETSRLVIAVDYDMSVPAEVARSAAVFATDDRGHYLTARDEGIFRDYPDPATTIGEAMLAGAPGRASEGRVLVTHLGVGLADLVFADAIVRRAIQRGAGVELPR